MYQVSVPHCDVRDAKCFIKPIKSYFNNLLSAFNRSYPSPVIHMQCSTSSSAIRLPLSEGLDILRRSLGARLFHAAEAVQRSLPHACACGTYHVHERISPCTPLLASPPFAPPAPYDFCTPHAAAPPGSAHPPPPPTPGPPCTFPRSTRATSLHLISYSRHDDPLPRRISCPYGSTIPCLQHCYSASHRTAPTLCFCPQPRM